MRKVVVFLAVFSFFLVLAGAAQAAYLYIDSYGNLSFASPGLPAGRQVLGEATEVEEEEALPVKAPAGKIQINQNDDGVEVVSPTGWVKVEVDEGETVVEVEEGIEMKTVKIKKRGDEFEIEHRQVGAQTALPISVNTETNELTVETPLGPITLTILPDQALAFLLEANIFDFLLTREAIPAAPEGSPRGVTPRGPTGIVAPEPETPEVIEDIELTEEDGVLVYRMRGLKRAKFLGFLPFQFLVEAAVSAETGELVSVDQPPFYRFFNFLFID